MSRINTAHLIAMEAPRNEEACGDACEGLQQAINDHLPDTSEDYRASVYALICDNYDGRIGLTGAYVLDMMEMADG